MENDRPNIILFTTDQHRGDYVGLAGHPVLETPNFDSFIESGAYFPNAYSEIPSTTGARRCMLGGQASYACGLIGYQGSEWHEPNTLAQVLADAGYHCINVGWRNLHPRRKLYGFHTVVPHDLREGDDDYWEWLTRELGPYAHERTHGSDANGWLGRPWPYEERFHPTNWTVDATLDQLRRRDPTRPVFLWCSHLRPHSPYDPPQFFWDMYVNRDLPPVPVGDWAARFDKPNPGLGRTAWFGTLTPEQLHRIRVGYMGCITHIDYQLGYLMERINREGLRNTLILFTADHGDMLGDHHLHRKCYAYEGSARIPFAIRYAPGMSLPTGRFEHVVGLQDVMPTLLEAAGVPVPDSVTGSSVFDAVRGSRWRTVFHGEHSPCYSKDMAMHYLTDGTQKYIWFPVTGEEQLFDLTVDRLELTDLAKHPDWQECRRNWRKRLVDILAPRGDGFTDGQDLVTRPDGYGPEAVRP
jgi:arylsulfatase A-like enzyme